MGSQTKSSCQGRQRGAAVAAAARVWHVPPWAWQGRRGQLRGHPGASLGPGLSPGAVTPLYFQWVPSPAPQTLSFTPQLQVHQGAPAHAPTPAPPSRFLFLLFHPKATFYHLHTHTTTCQPRCLSQTSPQGVCSPRTPRGALCPAGGGDVPAGCWVLPMGLGRSSPFPPPLKEPRGGNGCMTEPPAAASRAGDD